MLAVFIILAISAIPTGLMLACCAMAGIADRKAEELHRREGRRPGETHALASAGSTPAPATTPDPR